MCIRRQGIVNNRNDAKRKLKQSASKMLEQAAKKFKPAEFGQNVNVPIPDMDRGKLDPPNFTAVVKEFDIETGLYLLGTRVGLLDHKFSRNQFEPISERFLSIDDVPDKVLGVREAARLHSINGGQGFFKCVCQTKCQTKRCKCF